MPVLPIPPVGSSKPLHTLSVGHRWVLDHCFCSSSVPRLFLPPDLCTALSSNSRILPYQILTVSSIPNSCFLVNSYSSYKSQPKHLFLRGTFPSLDEVHLPLYWVLWKFVLLLTWGFPSHISGGIRLQIKCTINIMPLNHPETSPIPPWVCGKIVFHEIDMCYVMSNSLWLYGL